MVDQPTLGFRVPGGRHPRPEASRRPPRRRYAFGAEVERRARDRLAALGYAVVRSAGSQGAADLVALGPRDVLVLQIKAGADPPRPAQIAKALADLGHIPTPVGAVVRREVWYWPGGRGPWHRYTTEAA